MQYPLIAVQFIQLLGEIRINVLQLNLNFFLYLYYFI